MTDNPVQRRIRENIDIAIYEKEMTDSEFCTRTNIPIERLTRIRQGKCAITVDEIHRICASLNISADYLLGFSDILSHICYSEYSLVALDDENRKSAFDYIKYLLKKQNDNRQLLHDKEA